MVCMDKGSTEPARESDPRLASQSRKLINAVHVTRQQYGKNGPSGSRHWTRRNLSWQEQWWEPRETPWMELSFKGAWKLSHQHWILGPAGAGVRLLSKTPRHPCPPHRPPGIHTGAVMMNPQKNNPCGPARSSGSFPGYRVGCWQFGCLDEPTKTSW